MQRPAQITEQLKQYGQEHLLQWWDDLSDSQQQALVRQIENIDFALVDRLIAQRDEANSAGAGPSDDRAERATGPQELVRLPETDEDRQREVEARKRGEALLAAGKVGAILVAGGQGSRLGFDPPKGMYPIGPVSDRTLFHILCEQLLARSRRHGKPIPFFVMTSEATHEPTIEFFQQQKFFGLGEENVYFFQQASLPAVDDSSRRILMEDKATISRSPDGHGGMLNALHKAGLIDVMRERGIEQLYYHQVDNPTAIVCDPLFLGLHDASGSEMTTKAVAKVGPEEKMGVLVTVDGHTEIIEYSDLPAEQAARTNDDGSLVFWAGSTAIHVFRRDFLERLTQGDLSLPFHIAHKSVAYLDPDGTEVEAVPGKPNANKFEQFIFDALPQAKVGLVVEADRAREFNPVKNAKGSDSPDTCRAALRRIAAEWIEAAGGTVADSATVEVSPLFALDADELRAKAGGREFTSDTSLTG